MLSLSSVELDVRSHIRYIIYLIKFEMLSIILQYNNLYVRYK